jgi:hypothetical protein
MSPLLEHRFPPTNVVGSKKSANIFLQPAYMLFLLLYFEQHFRKQRFVVSSHTSLPPVN